ncbi:MAG TPA: DinB family protein [Vicinamibacterales bacterium]|nr:DinB family protein [Vicinamibacterales bacterium]
MNHRHLSELLDYHYWAQERVFDACEGLTPEQFARDLGNSFESVSDTLAHINFAERIWYARWNSEPMPAPMMLRLLGAKPVGTDLMVFYWEREQAASA